MKSSNMKTFYAGAILAIVMFVAGALAYSFFLGNEVVKPESGVGAEVLSGTVRLAYEGANTGSTTWCALENTGTNRRIILNFFAWKNATSSGGTAVMAATSTAATGVAISSDAMFNAVFPNAAFSLVKGYATTSPQNITTGTSSQHLAVWGAGTILKFLATSTLNTTESGACGVEYLIDPN